MKLNFLNRILKVLLIPPLLFFANEVKAQCDVFIEPGSVEVVDNGSGVKFVFDITNNSPNPWYGDVLKMYWTLNSGAPIWDIDYSTGTYQSPIAPGETRTIKTPWFDIPNLPSWFPEDPGPGGANDLAWEESMEWPYYGLSFPFEGSWAPVNLRLGSCGLGEGAWVYGPDGELYYGPTNTDCTDSVNDYDAICDCDLEIVGFNPSTLDIEVEVVSHWNCGQPLNGLSNINSANTDGVGMIHFGIHVPGWDYQWGCTTGNNHPGWAFTGWSALNDPNQFLYSGDVFEGNLNNLIPPSSCFNEILTNDTITECKEIVLWQINYSQTLLVNDGGWAVNENSGDSTQEYPDSQVIDNSILICEIPSVEGCTDPSALNYNPQADVDDGSCEYGYPNAYPGFSNTNTICDDGVTSNVYNITVFNSGDDTLFYYCVEIPELNYDECFDGYSNSSEWIPPSEGQFITQVVVPESIEEFTVNIYLSEGESEETLSNNSVVVPVVFNGPDPCPLLGCTDENAVNYNPDATDDDGSCEYLDLTLDLGDDIIWTPQGSCVNPFYNQSFVINNTGEGVIDNFSLEVTVVTWDGNIVYDGIQDYNVSIDPNGSYTVSDFPDVFTGDLNYVNATLTWINELGEIEEDVQTFNLILYCWGCTDPDANNYTESEYIFDEVQDYWLDAFPNISPPTPEQIECTYDITELTYVGAECFVDCDVDGPYWYVITTWTNTGNVEITDFCAEWDVTGGQGDDVMCFNGSLLPGETTTLQYGPYDFDFGLIAWAYLQEVNGVTFDTPIGNYENINCYGEAQASCVYGCMDLNANNYNPDADFDDGSCTYDVLGCTDPEANNFNPDANVDDGSCTYDVLGCTDPEAENYNPNANIDDGSCQIGGCTIEQACNYNPDATYNDGSCDFESCVGCTDPEAINYNPNATEDDGSCVYPIYGCTDPEAFNYDPLANTDDGSCIDVVVGCMIPEAINYNPLANVQCTPIDECCIFPEGCTDPEANNYDPNAIIDDGSCTYDVFGCTDMNALNYNPYATIDDGTCIYPGPCDEFDGSAFAPNAFTPNNDGLNDVWRVLTEEDCWNKWELIIYNRWGQVIYEMDSPSQFWDGSFRGSDHYVSDGVYAYTLRGVAWNLSTVETTGFITVLR